MSSTAAKTVFIVEDETPLAEVLEEYLRASAMEVERIEDGAAVVPRVREAPPDLILLDLMLPGRDGLEICRELRTFSSVPNIMVTARVEEIDRLLGLELGADDYVCKPFAPREVVARVKAQLRRVEMMTRPAGEVADDDDSLLLDEDRYEARLEGRALRLTVGDISAAMITVSATAFTALAELPAQVQPYPTSIWFVVTVVAVAVAVVVVFVAAFGFNAVAQFPVRQHLRALAHGHVYDRRHGAGSGTDGGGHRLYEPRPFGFPAIGRGNGLDRDKCRG